MTTGQIVGFSLVGGIALVMVIVAFLKSNLEVCEPNELLVFSGGRYTDEDGRRKGYRVIRGGRRLKIPFVESVSRLTLNTLAIDLEVDGALTAGTIPVDVRGRANVKIAGTEEEGLDNAVERFLGRPTAVVEDTAREILVGSMRGVLSTLEPEEANADRLGFARRVVEEAEDDLARMGLVLDTLKVQEISDEKGYLEAIARRKNSEVQRDARIAEADADAAASRRESEARKEAELADVEARRSVMEAENDLKVREAEWAARVNEEEERAEVAGEIARVVETKELQERRVEANRLEHEADVVVPARAEREALEETAAGRAATTREEGKAKAEALERLHEQWSRDDGEGLFMVELLPELVDKVSDVVASNLDVDRLTVVENGSGGGDGGGVPKLVGSLAGSVNAFLEQMEGLTGQDVSRPVAERVERMKEGAEEDGGGDGAAVL